MVGSQTLSVRTTALVELVDVTETVVRAVGEIGLAKGLAHVFTPHTTSAVLVNENEKGLVSDLVRELQNLVDWNFPYAHNRIDDNAPSHITGAFLGPSVVIPIANRKLMLGTWQSIFFAELDGPRDRRLIVTALGE